MKISPEAHRTLADQLILARERDENRSALTKALTDLLQINLDPARLNSEEECLAGGAAWTSWVRDFTRGRGFEYAVRSILNHNLATVTDLTDLVSPPMMLDFHAEEFRLVLDLCKKREWVKGFPALVGSEGQIMQARVKRFEASEKFRRESSYLMAAAFFRDITNAGAWIERFGFFGTTTLDPGERDVWGKRLGARKAVDIRKLDESELLDHLEEMAKAARAEREVAEARKGPLVVEIVVGATGWKRHGWLAIDDRQLAAAWAPTQPIECATNVSIVSGGVHALDRKSAYGGVDTFADPGTVIRLGGLSLAEAQRIIGKAKRTRSLSRVTLC